MSALYIYDVNPVLTSTAKIIIQKFNSSCLTMIKNFKKHVFSDDKTEEKYNDLKPTINNWKEQTNELFNQEVFDYDDLSYLKRIFDNVTSTLSHLEECLLSIYVNEFLEASSLDGEVNPDIENSGDWIFDSKFESLIVTLSYLKNLSFILDELESALIPKN